MRTALTRAVRITAAAVMATTVALTVAVSPAQADLWQHTDGFESSPAAVWEFHRSGAGSGAFELGAGKAHSGANNAILTTSAGGWSGVGKLLTVRPRTAGHNTTCGGGFFVQAVSGPAVLNVEVIDPASWTYLALRTVRITDTVWRRHDVASYANGPSQVFVRVSLLGGSGPVRVDDMAFQCTFFSN
ncbi:hypothetical protein [Micromonospora humida]|uniref:NADH:ubiquinone oxidoreductase intermediate-associated protein 30 domain-containing protein n=1 Tax=Micromonospora humida TaxID=2809018 RepID=A0ABS2ILC7_9ACTN|nr:hypothetical protein [Micromonospora humida]MBM7075142.1 hypothetical protein [Micromonospora humida]